MVYVRGGYFSRGGIASDLLAECRKFRSGCQLRWFQIAEPKQPVSVNPFYIDMYEVTNKAYVAFLNTLGTHELSCLGKNCMGASLSQTVIDLDDEGNYLVKEEFENHPVTGVTWYGAAAFCEARGARLPTEAEWEKAASWSPVTGEKTMYPWGDEFDGTVVNFCDRNCTQSHANRQYDDGYARTAIVGEYENGRSPVGAYDLAGNVWEWVADWFDPQYYGQAPPRNPQGPHWGGQRVVRGGSWFDTGNYVSSLFRAGVDPAVFDDTIGFRCVINEP
jgi:formylglycine-generating enzyme required for sulfatase activity